MIISAAFRVFKRADYAALRRDIIMRLGLFAFTLCCAALTACEAPPSVQKVIDEKAEEKAVREAPKMTSPVLKVAWEDGREVYDRYLLGKWSPEGTCENVDTQWTFDEETFSRPDEKPCTLAVIESLQDGSYALAGYCPRLKTQDEAEVVVVTRNGRDKIIIPGKKGGPLVRCPK